jgi:regulator of protease activity HflC (stomatin/prohibitin superfamily)
MKRKHFGAAILAGVTLFTLPACSYANMGPGEQAVVQDDYVMIQTEKKLIACVKPEESLNVTTNNYFKYPARQISWDATGDQGSERGPYVVVSNAKAPADMNVPVVVTFDLTTDCEKLKKFHADFGTKYSGWINDGDKGWVELLNYVVGQPLQDTLNAVAQKYTWQQIWNDESVRAEFREALAKNLPTASARRTDGVDFFTNFQVTVLKPTPVNPALKQTIEDQQANVQAAQAAEAKGVADANAARAKAEADKIAAEAQTALAQQRALQQQAEVAGYPNIDAYLKAKAIEAGQNPFQPTIVPFGGGQ